MELIKTEMDGLLILEPKVFEDSRGYFCETYSKRSFDESLSRALGYSVDFVQDNESLSGYGVIRGLHFQKPPFAQSKLVRCTLGRVLDVAVDLRSGSPTFGRYAAVELSSDNHRALFIPKGFAHGFSVLSPKALIQYKCDEFYHPESEGGIYLFDGTLGIDWGIPGGSEILSSKDSDRITLDRFVTPFEYTGNNHK